MQAQTNGFAAGTVLRVAYAMLGLTSSVVLATIILNICNRRKLPLSDYLVGLAFTLYVTMCALNIAASPYMHNAYAVADGTMLPYPELEQDIVVMIKMILVSFCMFWTVLWLIKFSLLILYRRLLVGISKRYTIIWWGIVAVCLIVSCIFHAIFPFSINNQVGSYPHSRSRPMLETMPSSSGHVTLYQAHGLVNA